MTSTDEIDFKCPDFEYPADFKDEVKDDILPEPPPFKASTILYVTSVLLLLGGVLTVLMDMLTRSQGATTRTFFDLLEWNYFSQIGTVACSLYVFMFWLGLMVDRRGA